MEIINRLYSQNIQIQQANDLLKSLQQAPLSMRRFPDGPAPLSPTQVWHSAAAAAWLQRLHPTELLPFTAALRPNLMMSTSHASQLPKTTSSKLSFGIDNIINGGTRHRERNNSAPVPQLGEHMLPSSPTHSSVSDGGLKYECEVCGKTYSTFSGFTKHKQFYCAAQASTKKQFNCKHCEKVYFSLGALKMHIRTHTLPCKCKVCGKAFSRPWLLQGHMRTHTGEKPFKCQHCGRAFADRSNLRAHLQTHSEVKKYSCRQCDKTFSRMSLLQKHEESACALVSSPSMALFT